MSLIFTSPESSEQTVHVAMQNATAEEVYYPLQDAVNQALIARGLKDAATVGFENSVDGQNPRVSVTTVDESQKEAVMEMLKDEESAIEGFVKTYREQQEQQEQQAPKPRGFADRVTASMGAERLR